jgi:gamma-butyrobetaine dioxygenase
MPDAIAALAELFASQAGQQYLREEVSVAAHMLQAGARAEHQGAADHVVASALLHDVGHIQPGTAHEQTGADWLSQWFGPDVTEPVRLHVAAKRYLCATEPGYFERLSAASIDSLARQGGPMSQAEAAAFAATPFAQDAIVVRRCDEDAKDPDAATPGFDHFVPLLRRLLSQR